MKVAIIGANGQLGSDLVEVFGEIAVPLTHRDLDVTNYDSLKILKKIDPDVIINTAAYVRVDDAEKEPKKAFNVNAIGALYVAKIANKLDAINVYISTDYVFDGRKGAPYTEEDMPNPINVYGASKYMGEIFTRNYSKKYYIVRVASLYGKKGARGKGGNFVNWIIEKARRGEEIKVVDDIIMSPTYTRDVAETLKKLLERKPEYGIYHMVNEGYCSWYEFAKEIVNILGFEIPIKPIGSNELIRLARRPKFSALENKKIHDVALRLSPWKSALKRYVSELAEG
ncbi:dTDP-4-dehydrorhamnose reductase [Candidatus Aciduliprofundum boonei]|uniref:dTDP-4-dehydrorhamnose reductase n=1 Tax=Aciduliprofundum boonei (strain DSM 19572 / T469) TaxID=439481 RepID=B5IDJ1_ACIB4|nr:dTDP-4-dehydrorhamnose reductase [Candidatus Aciduliprofundum boonei]ADD08066.1 dTDP-4-dehydrorhamnose reductase [Aciduliprofundum boonei T469]EDY35609.1 dTDP-4-dehydrorhamnose reductase [Aciduliprofundum boonei T469]